MSEWYNDAHKCDWDESRVYADVLSSDEFWR